LLRRKGNLLKQYRDPHFTIDLSPGLRFISHPRLPIDPFPFRPTLFANRKVTMLLTARLATELLTRDATSRQHYHAPIPRTLHRLTLHPPLRRH
jgi:hypothetical protein